WRRHAWNWARVVVVRRVHIPQWAFVGAAGKKNPAPVSGNSPIAPFDAAAAIRRQARGALNPFWPPSGLFAVWSVRVREPSSRVQEVTACENLGATNGVAGNCFACEF